MTHQPRLIVQVTWRRLAVLAWSVLFIGSILAIISAPPLYLEVQASRLVSCARFDDGEVLPVVQPGWAQGFDHAMDVVTLNGHPVRLVRFEQCPVSYSELRGVPVSAVETDLRAIFAATLLMSVAAVLFLAGRWIAQNARLVRG